MPISLTKAKGFFGLKGAPELKQTKKEEPLPEDNVGEPIAFIIKNNFVMEILENVPEGEIKVTRKIGDKEHEVTLYNPKSKLLTFPFANGQKRGWILDEGESIALPSRKLMDSLQLKRIVGAIVLNWKSIDEGQASNKWWFWLIIGGTGVLIISAMMGISIPELIFGKPAQQIVQVVVDSNKQVVTEVAKNAPTLMMKLLG